MTQIFELFNSALGFILADNPVYSISSYTKCVQTLDNLIHHLEVSFFTFFF